MIDNFGYISHVGLADVVGGKLWFCVAAENDERLNLIKHVSSVYFYTKKDCEKYIRKGFSGEMKTKLLSKLKATKGRAYLYC